MPPQWWVLWWRIWWLGGGGGFGFDWKETFGENWKLEVGVICVGEAVGFG